jgi:hypothetical protein
MLAAFFCLARFFTFNAHLRALGRVGPSNGERQGAQFALGQPNLARFRGAATVVQASCARKDQNNNPHDDDDHYDLDNGTRAHREDGPPSI